ncbi:MAG: BadF/BadG/BcrA/BcrD type ATPase [Chloroflexi bacterium]|nr:BadF/BadG/BcrA/BcrD type ATPase [Chloroflexota bacterium]
MELVIGLDGGGSRTRVRLANAHGETLGAGEAGPSNPQTAGLDAAQREIMLAIQRAFDRAGIAPQRVAAACLGIGGIERADANAELKAWAQATIAARVKMLNDGEILLAAGCRDNWGIAVIAGTGSIAWGRSRDGRIARAGGWGYLIGDEGSSFDLGREALRAAVHAADRRGQETRLLPAILEHWGLSEPLDLIPRVYGSAPQPAEIAALAPLVARVAAEGDQIARGLLAYAGEALADAAIAVAHQLEIENEEIPLALTGGLVLGNELLRERLLQALDTFGYHFTPVELVHEPVTGAIRLAVGML